jgi:hypothetical protein
MIREFISDRISLLLIISILAVTIFTITMSILVRDKEKKNISLKSQLTEINSLSEGLLQIKSIVRSKEKKISLTNSSGVVSTIEQTLKELGIEASVIKPLEKKHVKEFVEQDVELEIKDIDLNSIVNLIYRIENAPQPIKIKSTLIKTSFENPDRFMLKLTASLISKG